jgi:hypothetical protein
MANALGGEFDATHPFSGWVDGDRFDLVRLHPRARRGRHSVRLQGRIVSQKRRSLVCVKVTLAPSQSLVLLGVLLLLSLAVVQRHAPLIAIPVVALLLRAFLGLLFSQDALEAESTLSHVLARF